MDSAHQLSVHSPCELGDQEPGGWGPARTPLQNAWVGWGGGLAEGAFSVGGKEEMDSAKPRVKSERVDSFGGGK